MAKRTENKQSVEEIDVMIDEFSKKLEILRVRYEQYFIGSDKIPPSTFRMEVVRLMRILEQTKILNTASRFKLQTTNQKFTSYSTYWNRTLREMEDGTFRRHVDKAKRQQSKRPAELAQEERDNAQAQRHLDNDSAASMSRGIADEAANFLAEMGLGFAPASSPDIAKRPVVVAPAMSEAVPSRSPSMDSLAATVDISPEPRRPAIISAASTSDEPAVSRRPAIISAASTPDMPAVSRRPAIISPASRTEMPVVSQSPAIISAALAPDTPVVSRRPAIISPASRTEMPVVSRSPAIVSTASAPDTPVVSRRPAIISPASRTEMPVVSRSPAIVSAASKTEMPVASERKTTEPVQNTAESVQRRPAIIVPRARDISSPDHVAPRIHLPQKDTKGES